MKWMKRFDVKKVFLQCIVCFILFLILNTLSVYCFYKKYVEQYNQYIAYLIVEIKDKYPNVDEEEFIKKLNQEKIQVKKDYLLKYGIDIENDALLYATDITLKKQLVVSSSLIIFFLLMLLGIYFWDSYKKNKEIRKIIKTIKNVNQGSYELILSDYYEGDLSILNDEVYKTTLMLKEAFENSLKGKNELKESITNISHQLKTPLTSMSIMIDNLLNEVVDKDLQKEFLNDILYQVENMNFLIVALLKLSRFDADVVQFKREEFHVKDLILQALKNIQAIAMDKNIHIHVNGKSDVTFVGDFHWELEAITNILKNSIEHMDDDKNIYIRYSENHFYTKIEVEDEGYGISENDLKHIFERFYKGMDSHKNSVGVGLALAKEIVNKDNGVIRVTSVIKKGTIFTIKYFKKS